MLYAQWGLKKAVLWIWVFLVALPCVFSASVLEFSGLFLFPPKIPEMCLALNSLSLDLSTCFLLDWCRSNYGFSLNFKSL